MLDSMKESSSIESPTRRKRRKAEVTSDKREQLYNACEVGTLTQVQLAEVNIASLTAIMVDLDPDLLNPSSFGVKSFKSSEHFYEVAIRLILDRHPILRKAHIRSSGRGLHVLLKFAEPVEFKTQEERERWSGIVQVVQCLLPSDPRCPGITAVTRPLGSVNSKNRAAVKELAPGEPIAVSEIEALVESFKASPFRTIASLLWADHELSPCPICNTPDSRLDLLDQVGRCYANCDNVKLEQVFEHFYLTTKPSRR